MRRVLGIFALLLLCSNSYSQTGKEAMKVQIYFELDSYAIDSNVMQNNESLLKFSNYIDQLTNDKSATIEQIDIDSFTSPEGGKSYNQKLAERRSESIYNYLVNEKGVNESLITKKSSGTAWERLKELVAESSMASKNEIISIIENTPEETWAKVNDSDPWLTLVDSRNKQLMEINGGVPYNEMMDKLFPLLRSSNVVTIYTKVIEPEVVEVAQVQEPAPVQEPAVVQMVEPTPAPEIITAEELDRKLILAIKTNLLYDIALTPNIEVEVPIGERWSINGEFARGWWLKENTWCWQIQSTGLEARYWFGDRSDRDQLTGWFAGVFASTGFCDFQFEDAAGVQSDFFYVAGLSAGYSLPLSKSFNMEFSAGVGYILNEYQKYWVEDNTTLIEEGPRMKVQSLMPAKAKISLSWLIFKNKKN